MQDKRLCKQTWLLRGKKAWGRLCPLKFMNTESLKLRVRIPKNKRKGRDIFRKGKRCSGCPQVSISERVSVLALGVLALGVLGLHWYFSTFSWNTQVPQWSWTDVSSCRLPSKLRLSEEAAGGPQTQTQTPEWQKRSPLQAETQGAEDIIIIKLHFLWTLKCLSVETFGILFGFN